MSKLTTGVVVLTILSLTACDSATNDLESNSKQNQSAEENTELQQNNLAQSNNADSKVAPGNIPWFDGSIENAFAYAREVDKPLFLYWGAIWCPPCEQIKQTVFKHPTFLAQTQLFVPVYLDGDTEHAQYWGEHYAVAGYPTMVLFSPQGEELTRIPGGIETQHYIDVFQLALEGLKNTAQLLQVALTMPEKVSSEEFTQLAFYSWEQANLPEDIEVGLETFKQLAQSARAAGNGVAFSRLFFHYLNAVLIEQDLSETEFSAADKTQARQNLLNILANQDQVLANIDYMVFYAQDFVPMITEPGAYRRQVTQAWTGAMDSIRFSKTLSPAEQLATWYPQLYLHWINNPDQEDLPEGVQQALLAHINEIDSKTKGDSRQTVINKVYQVLKAAHLYDESRQSLLAEIEKSHSPYYFMSGLASLEEELGNKAEAVTWLQRAYEDAKGAATRFQWGVEYVDGLTRLQPRESELIATTTVALIDELARPVDVLSGRNFGRLQTLVTSVRSWQQENTLDAANDEKLLNFFNNLYNLCQATAAGSIEAENCAVLQDQLISG